MITIEIAETQDGVVKETVWMCEQAIDIEFNDSEGRLLQQLKIIICYNEIKNTGEKIITVIKLGDKQSRVGDSFGEHYDPMEDLSTTLETIIEAMFPDESIDQRKKLVNGIFYHVDTVINDEEMEWTE